MNIGYTDNDLLEKEWINKVRFFQVLEWPSQSPDLNLIKHMTVLKKHVCARKLTHLGELHRFCQERWLKIKPEDYQQLVDGYQKHLMEVIMAKGHLTKYHNCCMYIFHPADLVLVHH